VLLEQEGGELRDRVASRLGLALRCRLVRAFVV
jgi:hypothetical protein